MHDIQAGHDGVVLATTDGGVTWVKQLDGRAVNDLVLTDMVMPGDNMSCQVELITPIAMDKELRFAIREGGRTVGAGVITEVIA